MDTLFTLIICITYYGLISLITQLLQRANDTADMKLEMLHISQSIQHLAQQMHAHILAPYGYIHTCAHVASPANVTNNNTACAQQKDDDDDDDENKEEDDDDNDDDNDDDDETPETEDEVCRCRAINTENSQENTTTTPTDNT